MDEKFIPVFGRPIEEEEARRDQLLGLNAGNRDPDFLWGSALGIGGDTLSNPYLAMRIALTKGISIEEAVDLVHMMLWR